MSSETKTSLYAALLDREPTASELKNAGEAGLIRRILFSDEFFLLHEDALRDLAFKDRLIDRPADSKVSVIEDHYIDDLFGQAGDETFILACYQMFLGRLPEEEGFRNARQTIEDIGRFAYARSVMLSDEAQSRRNVVVTQEARDRLEELERIAC